MHASSIAPGRWHSPEVAQHGTRLGKAARGAARTLVGDGLDFLEREDEGRAYGEVLEW